MYQVNIKVTTIGCKPMYITGIYVEKKKGRMPISEMKASALEYVTGVIKDGNQAKLSPEQYASIKGEVVKMDKLKDDFIFSEDNKDRKEEKE